MASILDILSNEILDQIASHLEYAVYVCDFRLVCKTFAELGLRYLVPKLKLICLPCAFDRLAAVASHPVLRHHVSEIVYHTDPLPDIDLRTFQRFLHSDDQAPEDWDQAEQAFVDYKQLAKQFASIETEHNEIEMLLVAFDKLPKLRSLTIAPLAWFDSYRTYPPGATALYVQRWPDREFYLRDTVDVLAFYGEEPPPMGTRLAKILQAVQLSDTKLMHLCVYPLQTDTLSWWTQSRHKDVLSEALKYLTRLEVRPFNELDSDNPREDWVRADLKTVFSSSPLLESLRIWVYMQFGESNQHLCFERTLEGLVWPNLSLLELNCMTASSTSLMNFLEAHVATLRVLKLSDMMLKTEELEIWGTVFRFIADTFQLRDAAFVGDYTTERSGAAVDQDDEYRRMDDEVNGLGEEIKVGRLLSILVCSPYFHQRPESQGQGEEAEEGSSKDKGKGEGGGPDGQRGRARASQDEVAQRNHVLAHLFSTPVKRLAPPMSCTVDMPPEFVRPYRAALAFWGLEAETDRPEFLSPTFF